MKISEEDFAQLGLTDEFLLSAITKEAYQAYKESPSLLRLRKAIRNIVVPKLEEKAEQMNFKESLTGKNIRSHINSKLTDIVLAQLLEDYERTLGEIGTGKVTGVYEKKVAEKLFRGIVYEGKKITPDVLQTKKIVPVNISLTDANMNAVKFRRRKDRLMEGDDGEVIDYFNKQFSEQMKAIEEGIKLFVQESASTMREVDSFLEIRDDILSFMGATSKKVLANKNKIYTYWRDIAKKHEDMVKAVDELLTPEQNIDENEKKTFNEGMKNLRSTFEPLRTMNYIVSFEPMSVRESHEELLALDLLEAFQMRIGRSIDDNEEFLVGMEGAKEVNPEDITEEEKEIQDSVEGFYEQTSEKLDPISRYYISKMLNGIFVDSMRKESTITEVKDLAKTFGMDEIDLKNLDKFLADIPDITPTEGVVMLPAEFGDGFLTKRSKEGVEVKRIGEINTAYSRFIEELAKVIETGSFRIGRKTRVAFGTTAILEDGDKKTPSEAEKAYEQGKYSTSFSTRGMSWKELEKGQAEKVNAVINALNDYLFVPISNKVMTLGHSFRELRKTKEFKIISVYADTRTPQATSPSTKAVSVLYQRLERRGPAAFPKKHYTNLNNFMDSLRTQFDFQKIRKSANAAYTSLSQIYKKAGQDFLNDMKKGFGKLIGAIHMKTVEKGIIAPILEQYGVTPKDLDEDFDVSDITAFTELIDFFLENQGALGKAFERDIKKLEMNFNRLSKSKGIRNRILEAHDAFRILKGMPIYYGRGDISDIEDVSNVADSIRKNMGINIVATEIVKMVEEVDSFANIAMNIGVTEETVYFVKANFR